MNYQPVTTIITKGSYIGKVMNGRVERMF